MMTVREMFERMKPGRGFPVFLSREDSTPPLRCPTCARPMNQRRLHQLDLDSCDNHGIWFDGDELEQTLYRYALSD